jgi:hypothetical protein
VTITQPGGATITQPGGAQAPFYRVFGDDDLTQPNAFSPAPGLNADLTMPDSTHNKLKFHAWKVVDTFTLPSAGGATCAHSVKRGDDRHRLRRGRGSLLDHLREQRGDADRADPVLLLDPRMPPAARESAGGTCPGLEPAYGVTSP